MSHYQTPLRDMQFVLDELLDVPGKLCRLSPWSGIDSDMIHSVLSEAARFCEKEIAPLKRSGDEEGCRIENGQVRTPPGFKQAYRTFAEGGWCGLTASKSFGGQGMPGWIT